MSQCPKCNAAIWIGQRYCSTCDSYLPNPEEEDHFCPQCGIRVAPQQEFCQKCNLLEMAGASFQTTTRSRRLPPWVTGVFIGTGLVIVVLLLIFLVNKSPEPPLLIVPPPTPLASGQTPATSPPRMETAPSAPMAPAAKEPSSPSAPGLVSPPELKTPAPSPPMYFVNVHGLALRDGPTMSAPQIHTLNFKDEVELLETSDGWGRIRDVQRDIVGWSNMRYIVPVKANHQ
jgi:hypothetical protein